MVSVPAEILKYLSTGYELYHTSQKNATKEINWLESLPILLQGQSICGENGDCGRHGHIHQMSAFILSFCKG